MNHFEGVVLEYLRADRSLFINSQCCIQLSSGENPDSSGPHWYCDAVAVSFSQKAVYLCEITYSSPPTSLMKRLNEWSESWQLLRQALVRDSGVPDNWDVFPWLFVPVKLKDKLEMFLNKMPADKMPRPAITMLEEILPWRYRSWNRPAEDIRYRTSKRARALASGYVTDSYLYDLVDKPDTDEMRAAHRKTLIDLGLSEDEAKSCREADANKVIPAELGVG